MIKKYRFISLIAVLFVCVGMYHIQDDSLDEYENLDEWSKREKALISSMNINNLDPFPEDPSNKYANNKLASDFGEKIFNDTRFSANNAVSCATCHKNDYNFTDDLALAKGISEMNRRSMPLEGVAYQKWFFWDGRKDALWAQVLDPIESPIEHGISRIKCAQLIQQFYQKEYETVFGEWPTLNFNDYSVDARPDKVNVEIQKLWDEIPEKDQIKLTRVYVNMGKSIAAFIGTLKPAKAPLDIYASAVISGDQTKLNALNSEQKKGLRLFLNKGGCISCHNGPLLSNGQFHHVGIPDKLEIDKGRAEVVKTIEQNEFGCGSIWSDADPTLDCNQTKYRNTDTGRYYRAFKTPILRNVAERAPYMHAGQFNSLYDVLKNYQKVSGKPPVDEIFHGELTDIELAYLEAFLQSLTSIKI